jgi:hypothetical protein
LTTRQFKPVKKDRLFYGQFEYCIGFHLDEVNCLRVLDHDHIDEFITRRKQWREIAQQRWVNGRQKHGIIMSRSWRDITEKTVADLHVLADILLATQYEFKLVVSVNQGHVYTNDQDLIDQLDLMPAATFKTYTQAQISRPKNSIQLKNSQHAFRSYFKLLKLTAEQKDQLVNFLLNQQDHVRLSPSLLSWMRQPFNRTQDYFFVDHDTQAWLTMLSLIQSGIIRKTMPITTDK